VKQVQSGNLDDRPLYWARLKMQVRLKQHYLFEKDIDFEKNIVKKGTELERIIQVFEEKSRNYDGINFSKTGSKKKVLITGFDPFTLNQFKFKKLGAKVNVQNPSGVSALFFHGKTIGNAFIQCSIVPVRYKDFDNEIIEKLVQNNINKFDIMMTTSRNDNNFDLERFACKFRGSFYDNMGVGDASKFVTPSNGLLATDWDISKFKQITSGNEFYESTLPISKILVGDLDPIKNIVYYDQSILDDIGYVSLHPNKGGLANTITKNFALNIVTGKSTDDSGSGGDYLSNEIMYRSTRKRDEMGFQKTKSVGHIHLTNGMAFNHVTDILTKILDNATK
jgi:pyrrolidone-carboxylate peptidase